MADSLYVLDGYSIIYRSYFAFIRNPLRNPRGQNASAVFGFTQTLINLFAQYRPRHFVIALDSIGPTFRHELYPEYKATRDATPDDLKAQFPIIEELITTLGVPAIRVNGFEADDIMAGLSRRANEAGMPCRVISGDKDLLQLVTGETRVLRPGSSGLEELTRDAVFAGWGVWPEQIGDYLALIGDSADNIPGVKGIGPKSAVKLLADFGSLDGIYQNLDAISAKGQRTKLADDEAAARLSRRLVALRDDVELPAGPDGYPVGALNLAAAAGILLEQGMHRLLQDAGVPLQTAKAALAQRGGGVFSERTTEDAQPGVPKPGAPPAMLVAHLFSESECAEFAAQGSYELVDTLEHLDAWLERVRRAKVFAFDTETTSIDPMVAEPVGFSIATEIGSGCYVPLVGPDGPVIDAAGAKRRLVELLSDTGLRLIGQNIKYDAKVLARWGVEVRNVAFDTMVAAWLVDTGSGSYGMDGLAERYLGYRTVHYKDLLTGAGLAADTSFAQVPLDVATRYAAEDADVTLRLFRVLDRILDLRGARELFETVEIPLIPLLIRMELAGIALDSGELARYSVELEDAIASTERRAHEAVGRAFNLGSPKQLQEILFTERKLQPLKKTKTGYSTDNSVLTQLAREDEVPRLILDYRGQSKLKSTYVDALPKLVNEHTGRIHTDFHINGTATGRISSSDPNLQNIPIKDEAGRRIRAAFVARDGWSFVSADYAQIELVVLAHLSGDVALREAFATGDDVHRRTAAQLFGLAPEQVDAEQRRVAKTINFGVMYGMSAFRLSNELGISRADASAFIEAYFGTYRGIQAFIRQAVTEAERTGEVRTLLGRPRPILDIDNKNKMVKAGAERIAVNTPIQGSAADIVKRAMLALDVALRARELRAYLLLQVHDELILECPDDELDEVTALVTEVMSTAVELDVPLRVSVETGRRWGDMH